MVSRCFHNRPFGRFTVFFLLAVALAVFTPEAPKARAATSGSGAWDFLVFGNYDMSTVDTGNISSSQSYNTALAATGQATSFANTFQNGYGAGLAIVYWFNDVLAFRVGAQGNFFEGKGSSVYSGDSLQSAPLFGGFEAKLYGDPDYFLYGVIDAGAAYEESVSGASPTLSNYLNHGWSAYGDIGLGLNLDWIFVEVKFAYMPQFVPDYGHGQNGFYYVPVTAGFNF
ncbi:MULTISPECIES: hypothetical protein [Leptospirillum]|jgi:hypothetical protein|uniref:hypothetical protein n=1 Tax=Leptospirillum TaxID=179 RepID=UPI0000F0C9A1|nr:MULTISPECIES: hypothetical protein [Leptospirillum]EAY57350.1 MAG: protein of unknown function [Leptospirillum rubarum]EIJ77439.1 MAG: hypothetical protein C75L2_00720092 [Leptospirillum sp. Group II 'C75']MCL5259711.1 hypothetical protein [Nitrospirota bacterium]AKS23866.1 hypothetical protein ABH19_09155 [Leptospirillum sp. Group II 'CF-1']OOH79120.1 hypothetical protein BOX30_07065 [Leptospirillum ferriphilum]